MITHGHNICSVCLSLKLSYLIRKPKTPHFPVLLPQVLRAVVQKALMPLSQLCAGDVTFGAFLSLVICLR